MSGGIFLPLFPPGILIIMPIEEEEGEEEEEDEGYGGRAGLVQLLLGELFHSL